MKSHRAGDSVFGLCLLSASPCLRRRGNLKERLQVESCHRVNQVRKNLASSHTPRHDVYIFLHREIPFCLLRCSSIWWYVALLRAGMLFVVSPVFFFKLRCKDIKLRVYFDSLLPRHGAKKKQEGAAKNFYVFRGSSDGFLARNEAIKKRQIIAAWS